MSSCHAVSLFAQSYDDRVRDAHQVFARDPENRIGTTSCGPHVFEIKEPIVHRNSYEALMAERRGRPDRITRDPFRKLGSGTLKLIDAESSRGSREIYPIGAREEQHHSLLRSHDAEHERLNDLVYAASDLPRGICRGSRPSLEHDWSYLNAGRRGRGHDTLDPVIGKISEAHGITLQASIRSRVRVREQHPWGDDYWRDVLGAF
jgi:hypothetical protein